MIFRVFWWYLGDFLELLGLRTICVITGTFFDFLGTFLPKIYKYFRKIMGKFRQFIAENQDHQAQAIQNLLTTDDPTGYKLMLYIDDKIIESTLNLPTEYIQKKTGWYRVALFLHMIQENFPLDFRFIDFPEFFESGDLIARVIYKLTEKGIPIPKFIEKKVKNMEYRYITTIFREFIDNNDIQPPECVQNWISDQPEKDRVEYLEGFIDYYIRTVDKYYHRDFYRVFPKKWLEEIGSIKKPTQKQEIFELIEAGNIPLKPEYFGGAEKISMTSNGAYRAYIGGDKSPEVLKVLAQNPRLSKEAIIHDIVLDQTFTIFPVLLETVRKNDGTYVSLINDMCYRYLNTSDDNIRSNILEFLNDEIFNHFLKVSDKGFRFSKTLYYMTNYEIPLIDKLLKHLPKDIDGTYVPSIITISSYNKKLELIPENLFDSIKSISEMQTIIEKYFSARYPVPNRLIKSYQNILNKISESESECSVFYMLSDLIYQISKSNPDYQPDYQPAELPVQDILDRFAGYISSSYYAEPFINNILIYNLKSDPSKKLKVPDSFIENLNKDSVEYLMYRINSGNSDFSLNDIIPIMTSNSSNSSNFSKYYLFDKFSLTELKKHESSMSEDFKKFYFYPRIKAEKYNRYYDGIFIHATGNIKNTLKTYLEKDKNPAEICVSTIRTDSVFRSPKTDKDNALILGYGNIRLLFDFDAYTNRDDIGRRYATTSLEDEEEEPTDFVKKIPNKWKKFSDERSKYGDYDPNMHMDEGIMDLKTCEILVIVADSKNTIREARKLLGKHRVKIISFEKYESLRSSDRLMRFLDMLKTHQNDRQIYGQPFHKYEEMLDVTPFRDFLLTERKIDLNLDRAYDLFSAEYLAATGKTWDKDKFLNRSSNWDFYGDENGFVAVRNQRSGFVKLVGMAGSMKSKYKGFKEIIEIGVPLWGMVSKDIAPMALKMGMRVPNWLERNILKKAIDPSVFGNAKILGYTNDGGIEFDYPDIGRVTKYFIGTPAYYKKVSNEFKNIALKKIGIA